MILKKWIYFLTGPILCTTLLFTVFCSNPEDATGPEDEVPITPGEITGAIDSDLQNTLDFGQLSLLVPSSEVDIGDDGSFDANFLVGSPESLQTAILPVLQNDQPVLLTYACSNSSLNPLGTTMEIGAQSTALALVMMHPLFYGSTPQGRVEIANRVATHTSFASLVTQVSTAVQNDPTTYLDSLSTYDALYQQAGEIALSVFDAIVPVQKPSGTISKPTSRPKPYAAANNTSSIKYFNPYYIFYGTGVYDYNTGNNVQTFLQSPRDLYWGVVPFVGDYGETVQSLSQGDYTFKLYKGFNWSSVGIDDGIDPSHPSGRSTWANTLMGILNIVGLVCPYAEGTNVNGLLSSVDNFSSMVDLSIAVGSKDVTQMITAFIFFINDNRNVIVQMLWSPQDANNVGKYLSKLNGALSNVALPLKVLQAETKVPFFFDLAVDAPSEEIFSRRFQNGMLTNIELGPIQVTQPDAETEWELGEENVTITWNTGNVPGNVTIDLYKGSSLEEIISNDTPNDGLFDTWDVTSTLDTGDNYTVKISSLSAGDNSDFSDPFTIRLPLSNIEITEPNSSSVWMQGQQNVTITWEPDNVTGNVAVALYKGDVLVETLASATNNDGDWIGYDVPSDMTPGTDYRIKVTPLSYPVYYGISDDFEIKENVFEVTEPNSGTVWQLGQQDVAILWGTGNVTGTVDIALFKSSTKVEDVVTGTTNDGSHTYWDVPGYLNPATDYRVKITSTANSSIFDFSDYFEIESVSGDPYEPNNSRNDAYAVGLSGTPATWQSGSGPEINPKDDQDWFRFAVSGGYEITITCDVTSQLDAGLLLYYNETKVDDMDGGNYGEDEILIYSVPAEAGGTYYAAVVHYSDMEKTSTTLADTGSYELTIMKTGHIEVTEPTASTVWMQGQNNVPIRWKTGTLGGNVKIELYELAGFSGYVLDETITSSTSNDGIYTSYDVSSSQTAHAYYRVKITSLSDPDENDMSETFTIRASSSDPYEPNDTRHSAYRITFSGSPPAWSSGSGPDIDSGDEEDWFTFTASEGEKLTVYCDVTSNLDPEIVIYYHDPDYGDSKVASKDSGGSGGDETLSYTIPSGGSGTYYVGVSYYANFKPSTPEANTGSYQLTITKETLSTDPYEPNDTHSAAYAISFSGTPSTWSSGSGPEIDPSTDQDWFSFSASSGDEITVEIDATSSLEAELVLYYNGSQVKDTDTPSSLDFTMTYTVSSGEGGTYYLGVGYWNNIEKPSITSTETGSYELTITKVTPSSSDPYEPNDTRSSAYAISFSGTPPTWSSGTGPEIDPGGDVDWFRFTASAGENITVECDVTSDLDPEIVIYYGSSKVANKDAGASGSDETLSYTVPSGSSGTYYVGVAWYINLKPSTPAANTGSYRLTITKESGISGDIVITEPASSTVWTQGQQNVSIQWDTGSLGGNVKIELYKGASSQTTITSSTANDGSYTVWDVPSGQVSGTDYRIKVTSTSNSSKYDYSDYFSIQTAASGDIEVILPNSSTVWTQGQSDVVIMWETGDLGGTVKIELYKGSGLSATVMSSTNNDGSYQLWDVPSDQPPGTDYRIKVTSTSNSSKYDYSSYFEIQGEQSSENYIISVPNSLTQWAPGDYDLTIRWDARNDGENVNIELYKGNSLAQTIANNVTNDGSHNSVFPSTSLIPGSDYRVKISNGPSKSGYSDYFEIVPQNDDNIRVMVPNSSTWVSNNEQFNRWPTLWTPGENEIIFWEDGQLGGNVKIELFKGGGFHSTIKSSIMNNGSNSWTVPSNLTPGSDYQIKITSLSNSSKNDMSEYFVVESTTSSLEVTSPSSGTQWNKGQQNVTVTWNTGGIGGNVKIELWRTSINHIQTFIIDTPNDGSYTIPQIPVDLSSSTNYMIRITHRTNFEIFDFSSFFGIQ
ncbi:pre-peptidase C-terminal domain-containing protein [bacterium]|nr:pre-peptidase C-terminal domain-containing protein [bacterium]RQV94427.1 MAG: hypothetical protein EH221_08240 [bacterium]